MLLLNRVVESYFNLINENFRVEQILNTRFTPLNGFLSGYISHNSIKVAVPGR